MRFALFGAALLLGTAAIAQPPADDTTETTTEMTTETTTETTQPASTASTTMQTSAGTTGGGTVAPSNSNPETDARGIPVISAPATAPSGWNVPYGQGTPAPAGSPAPAMGTATDLPPCSRTVTDRCVQTYERGRAPR